MIQMQEAKKKAYSLSSGQNYLQDPIKYVNRLTTLRKAITEIKVPKDSPTVLKDGFVAIQNFYKDTTDESQEYTEEPQIKQVKKPHELIVTPIHIEFTDKENTFKKNSKQNKAKYVEDSTGMLEKRSAFSKLADEQGQPVKYKYTDPLTGVYYNTIEEFKKLRQLWAVDQKKHIEKSMHYLGVLNSTKSKRLSYLLTNNE